MYRLLLLEQLQMELEIGFSLERRVGKNGAALSRNIQDGPLTGQQITAKRDRPLHCEPDMLALVH
jgi:hypothetical protein